MDEDAATLDSGFDDDGPFRGTPGAGGISLESAWRDFGPAAIDDLIPRVRELSSSLDAAHAAGVVHGALHPSRIIIADEATSIIRGIVSAPPYIPPEVVAGAAATAASDQYALAAITYEWLFGRPIAGPAVRKMAVRSMPGVDRIALSAAFTRALAPEPEERFASCSAFCSAVAASAASEHRLLPLEGEAAKEDPIEPFLPEEPAPNVDDIKIVTEETILTAAQPDLDTIDAIAPAIQPREAVPYSETETMPYSSMPEEPAPALASWNPSAAAPPASPSSQRFGGFALILATIVGAIFGFAAGYMARPRALQSGPAPTMASTPATDATIPAPAAPSASAPAAAPATLPPAASSAPAQPAQPARPAASAPTSIGRLLVRSTPSGASVSVDGVAKGVTPLALGDIEVGTRDVTIARRGFITESRRVQITKARPSRSLDVRLAAAATPAAPRPATPATLGKPAPAASTATTGGLSVESRPAGATVTINGKPSGVTPLAINDLPPGEYRILMTMPGYRDFAASVRVVAGERARAAASLTVQEQE
ncbi:MAG TPA: PEGA domain-containing protein [Vicinamibacterales bacterium]